MSTPIRVDFAGGWLDVPALARDDGYIVNMTVTPFLEDYPYEHGGGIGGSAAATIAAGGDALTSELAIAGWQDAAVIARTGLCVWHSGARPDLCNHSSGAFLAGQLAIWWTGQRHDTHEVMGLERHYDAIARAGRCAREGVVYHDAAILRGAVAQSYAVQLAEGMEHLPVHGSARKYLGAGWGGYALYMFTGARARDLFVRETPGALAVEPYLRREVT